MAEYSYRLAYRDIDEFIAKVRPQSLRRGNRVSVKLSDNTDYVFTYRGTSGDQITGISALNGQMIIIDLERMTLLEQAAS